MREILFRGKRVDDGKWVQGDFVSSGCGIAYTDYLNEHGDIGEVFCKVVPESVSEFTGLTDKNGKKIFEGDYVINKIDEGTEDEITCIEYVGFMDGSFGFIDHIVGDLSTNDCFTPFEYCNLDNTVICGNIHDNPELLKEGAT